MTSRLESSERIGELGRPPDRPLVNLGSGYTVPILANVPGSGVESPFIANTLGSAMLGFDESGIDLLLGSVQHQPAARTRLDFISASTGGIEPCGEPLAVSHYLLGDDPHRWATDRPGHSGLCYQALYPGIDLEIRLDGRRLFLQFHVAPEADVAAVRWRFPAATVAHDVDTGDIAIGARGAAGERHLVSRAPQAEQQDRTIEVAYSLDSDGVISLRLGEHAATTPISISVKLEHSAYFDDYVAAGLSSKHLVVAGGTPFAAARGVQQNVFVATLDFERRVILRQTFIGGTDDDRARGVVLDAEGQVHLTGVTGSDDFPSVGKSRPRGGGQDAFVLSLTPSADKLLAASYLGGPGDDVGSAILLEADGTLWVAGSAGDGFPQKSVPPERYATSFPVAEAMPDSDLSTYFMARLQVLGHVTRNTTSFEAPAVEPPLAMWSVASSGLIVVGGASMTPPCVLEPHQMTHNNGLFPPWVYDGYAEFAWGYQALAWKAQENPSLVYSPAAAAPPVVPVAPPTINDGAILNANELNAFTDAFANPVDPPGTWGEYFTHADWIELVIGAAIAMDRWGTPVYTSQMHLVPMASAMRRVDLCVAGGPLSVLCPGWTHNGTPIDDVDKSCVTDYYDPTGTKPQYFQIEEVRTYVWNHLGTPIFSGIWYLGTGYAPRYMDVPVILDPPAEEQFVATALGEATDRIRNFVHVAVDVEQVLYEAGVETGRSIVSGSAPATILSPQ